MSDQKLASEHRRLAILRHLEASGQYTSNGSILIDTLRGLGIGTSEDQMKAALSWLEEQELITMTDHGHIIIAVATPRGVDVANGQTTHPGVKRPTARG